MVESGAARTNLLITGGAGFIGINLVAYLSHQGGYKLTVLDNESQGDRRRLAPFEVTFVHGDVRDSGILDRVVPGQDAVIHLAAETGVASSVEAPERNFDVNAAGSLRLLEACRRHSVERVIAISTGGAILGEAPAPVREDMMARPLSPYGASKLAMEGYLSAFAASYGLKTVSLRISNIYGPHALHKDSVVARYCKLLLADADLIVYEDGSQARDFLFVEDLVDGIRKALESDAVGVLQFGSGQPTTIRQLVTTLAVATGRETLPVCYSKTRVAEVHTTWCDISLARSVLHFEPRTSLVDGLTRTWEWFRREAAVGT